jgi:segregation and condensation protein B
MSDEATGREPDDIDDAGGSFEQSPADAAGEPIDAPMLQALHGKVDADLVRAIEAIVLVASDPVDPGMLAQLLEVPVATVIELCTRLSEAYLDAGHGFILVRVAGGYRYQTHPDVAPYVERFVLDGQRARMSAAALETLAIVAYKQPISRAQIASIRGVDPDGVLRTLQARGYVDQAGRDPGPGQAVLWGTTPEFLEKLGLNSVADLPPIVDFVPGADVVEALEHGLRVPAAKPEATGVASDGVPAAFEMTMTTSGADDAPADPGEAEIPSADETASVVDDEVVTDAQFEDLPPPSGQGLDATDLDD